MELIYLAAGPRANKFAGVKGHPAYEGPPSADLPEGEAKEAVELAERANDLLKDLNQQIKDKEAQAVEAKNKLTEYRTAAVADEVNTALGAEPTKIAKPKADPEKLKVEVSELTEKCDAARVELGRRCKTASETLRGDSIVTEYCGKTLEAQERRREELLAELQAVDSEIHGLSAVSLALDPEPLRRERLSQAVADPTTREYALQRLRSTWTYVPPIERRRMGHFGV